MGKKPKIIYTDDEKAIASGEFQAYVESENIELYRTRGHPAFAERFIKTFKYKLCKRVDTDEKNKKTNIQWIDYIDEIMLTYKNKDVHSATGQTRYKARDKDMEEYLKDDEARIAKLKQIWKTINQKTFQDFNPIIVHIIIYENLWYEHRC